MTAEFGLIVVVFAAIGGAFGLGLWWRFRLSRADLGDEE